MTVKRFYALGHQESSTFFPQAPAAMIRIGTSSEQEHWLSLRFPTRFKNIFTYDFIDVTPEAYHERGEENAKRYFEGGRYLEESLARQIITDFASVKDDIEEMVLHCYGGARRAPTVCLALIDIFSLGNSAWTRNLERCRKYLDKPHPLNACHHIYHTMMQAAKSLGLKKN